MRQQLSSGQFFQAPSLQAVQINDRFWQPRIEANRQISLPYQYNHLKVSGVLDNFLRATGKAGGKHAGPYWMDSDAYKWLEATCYSLTTHPDPELEVKVDEVIAVISEAQEKDGYLNTYFQWVEPEKKWTNLGMGHELYCAGHLIQAAIAHFNATGKNSLLETACRFADHIDAVFGPGKLEGLPGHEEIEMALVDLYRLKGEIRYLHLAQYFINQRGNPNHRFRWELGHLDEIGGGPVKLNQQFYGTYEKYDGRYSQDHLPVREQREVVGHAVRAMYLYCGMADLAAETGEAALLETMERLWENVTQRRMYVTGGIGPSNCNEGFTHDYDLPNDTAYAETCAAVGMIMWNYRLLQLKGQSRFADIMEQVLYNGFLAGVSLDSRRFFYINPLFSTGEHHRQGWFQCACCPPNVARLLASLGGYIYSKSRDGLAVHLYIQSSVQVNLANGEPVILHQETNYPWEGRIRLRLELAEGSEFTLLLRIPGWCRKYELAVNHQSLAFPVANGYASLKRVWEPGDLVELDLEMPVEILESHPAVWQNTGRVALQRGPLIYCLEEVDHSLAVNRIMLPEETEFKTRFDSGLLGGVTIIECEGLVYDLKVWEKSLYRSANFDKPLLKVPVKAIPYYAWDNREPGTMAVWLGNLRERGGGKEHN
jgi:DUF1680 family protein